jgi:hypothetical protein
MSIPKKESFISSQKLVDFERPTDPGMINSAGATVEETKKEKRKEKNKHCQYACQRGSFLPGPSKLCLCR